MLKKLKSGVEMVIFGIFEAKLSLIFRKIALVGSLGARSAKIVKRAV